LNEFGESGIQILVYVFWNTPDWSTELRERHRFMLDLMRLSKELDVSFAYPTQTVYLARAQQKHEEPKDLHVGQKEFANHESGRDAARKIMKGAGWDKNRPDAYRYTLADKPIDGMSDDDAGDGDGGDGGDGG
jgi:MscS family membrane protein